MLVRMIAAALTDVPLGAPGIVNITNQSSTGNSGNMAGVIFSSTESFYVYRHGVPIESTPWLTADTADNYEIYATVLSGDTPTGTIGAWTPLTTTQEYTLQEFTPSTTQTCQLQIEIRWTGNNVVQDTATYTITSNG